MRRLGLGRAKRREIGLLGALVVGVLVALQARVNGELGARIGDGVAAALISFGTGLALLCVVVVSVPRLRSGLRAVPDALRSGRLVWWQCAGGACGAFLIACQGLTVATVGVAVFTVAVVAGQLFGSLWVDRKGLGPAGPTPVTATRLGAVAVAIGAAAVAGAGSFGAGSWWFAVLPAIAGVGLAWQQAVNGRVATVGGPVAASWVNFAVGTVLLLVVVAAAVAVVRGVPGPLPREPWLYVGGLQGVVLIAVAALVVRWIGVLVLGLVSVAGQLGAALVLDAVVPSGPAVTPAAVVACGLTLSAALLAAR
ncbi:MAG TPA: DMT family transporter [Aldersonia sp.]